MEGVGFEPRQWASWPSGYVNRDEEGWKRVGPSETAPEAPVALEAHLGRLPGRGVFELNLEGWER